MRHLVFILLILFIAQKTSVAQDTLPRITVTQISNKVLVSWMNPYTTLTNIGIQRSYDSLKNFTTIGSVLNVKAPTNGFVDQKEFIPPQFYRLFISFEGGTYVFTESHRPSVDTLKVAPASIATIATIEVPKPVQTWFIPSKQVYTGKDYNVIISLPEHDKKKYSVKFFEDDGTFLFEIRKITDSYLTVDKVNFVHAGLFGFEVFDNGVLIEKHKLYIPKDGKTIPLLDEQGHEVQ